MSENLHVWVLGASSGIGAATARLLSGRHRVTASSRRTPDYASGSMQYVSCDVSSAQSINEAHRQAVATFGPVDVLVYSAGVGLFKPLIEISEHEFDDVVAVNLKGMFLCSQVVLPSMMSNQRGMIVDVNSVATQRAFARNSVYAATKAGTLALARSLREECRTSGVKVVELIVGATVTDIWSQEAQDAFGSVMLLPEDVASIITNVVDDFSNARLHVEEILVRPQLGDLP